jgi:hypothetical protein
LKNSKGWFERVKTRTEIKSVFTLLGADEEEAENFKTEFKELMEEEGFLPQQAFGVVENCLFGKKMPSRTYNAKDERTLSEQKPMKDW